MEYVAPTTVQDAVQIANESNGNLRYLAGGTDVLVQLHSGLNKPDLVIDLKRIDGMQDIIRTSNGGWKIGAAVSSINLGSVDQLRDDWPGVVEASELIGSTQIQGRASLVGNLCNASPAADGVPALVAAGATVEIAGRNGNREISAGEVATGPGQTSLKKGEVVVSINLPPQRSNGADAYLRFIPRTEMDIAVVGCAINLVLDQDVIAEASVALGAVAPTVVYVTEAANAIQGSRLDDTSLEKLASACRSACNPIDDKRGTAEFRIKIAGVLSQRVARLAYNRASQN